jgi:hypothetical protein
MRISAALATLAVLTLPISSAAQTTASQTALDSLKEPIRTRVTCSIQAAKRFGLPANLVIAVAEQEGGHVGQWVQNKNGSYDVGPMQFNTVYLRHLERFGITASDVEADGCYPYELAAWRLRRHLDRDDGDLWTRAANYHSRTPIHNARYRAAIRVRAAKWAHWLSARVPSITIAALDASLNPSPASPVNGAPSYVARVRRVGQRTVRDKKHHAAQKVKATSELVITTHANVVETLAGYEAHRREQLLELICAGTDCTASP